MRKRYSAKVRRIVKNAMALAERLKKEGWTREDSANAMRYPMVIRHRKGETAAAYLSRCAKRWPNL